MASQVSSLMMTDIMNPFTSNPNSSEKHIKLPSLWFYPRKTVYSK